MTGIETISGAKGGKGINDTTAVTRTFSVIVANDTTVIAELYYSDDLSTNLIGSGETKVLPTGFSLSAGIPLICRNDKEFGKIKLASGSVIIH